jgi:hypothetical protein
MASCGVMQPIHPCHELLGSCRRSHREHEVYRKPSDTACGWLSRGIHPPIQVAVKRTYRKMPLYSPT